MTFLGLEKPQLYTPIQIFDPTAANIEARARDQYINMLYNDYQQGVQDMKEFYKEYGGFLSPIQKDMDWYANNVTGVIQDYVNDLYAKGIDPLRSAEGRAGISRLIAGMPYGKIAQLRQSAETAKEYIKNRGIMQTKGLWNPDYERATLKGGSLEDWDTVNGGVWTRTAPSEYQDLNQYTSHIFDNLKDSYIGTDKNHYDWYGVTENDLYKSLTPDKLGGLLNTDLGRFHYSNAIRDLAAQGNLNPSEAEKMEQFRKNIVAANHERVHQDRKLNELWKMQQENAARRSSGANYSPNQTNQYSIAELIRRTSSTRIVGQQTQEYGAKTLQKQRDAQIKYGLEVSKTTGGHSANYKGKQMFKSIYQDNEYSASSLTDFIVNQGFERADDEANTIIIPKHKLNRLSTLSELQSNTVGFRGKKFKSNLQNVLKNAEVVRATFTGGNYGAYMKNATNQNHFECIIKVGKKKYQNDDPKTGNYKYEWTPIRTDGSYFDSHITSQQDDPRAGSLGTKGKNGKVKETPNIPITNSQDTKYQDAVFSDRYTTDQYVKGSDYDFDAIYTELTDYPYKK